MVRGIDKFREFFTGYEGNYVIIGGTACEMHEEIYAQTPRATKDIDIILIVDMKSGNTTVQRATEDEMQEMYESGVDLFFNIETYLK